MPVLESRLAHVLANLFEGVEVKSGGRVQFKIPMLREEGLLDRGM